MKTCFFLCLILVVAASACVSTPAQEPATAVVTDAVTPTRLLSPTSSPSPAPTFTAIPSSTPTVTVTPTLEPNLPSASPPAVTPGAVISPENASRVVELAGWGEGYDFNLFLGISQIASGGRLLIQKEFPNISLTDSGEITRTRFWDLPSGELRLELIHPNDYGFLFASPDGTRYAVFHNFCQREVPEPCSLEVWLFPENELLLTFDPGFITTGIFSPDNRLLALSTENGIAIWDLTTGDPARTLTPARNLDILRFSQDRRLLAGTQFMSDGTVTVWQVEDGQQAASLVSEAFPLGYSPNEMAFAPDDALLVMAYGGSAVPWKVSDWSEGPPWNWGDTRGINRLAFSPDGRLLASGGSDGSIVLADAVTGKVLSTWDSHTDETYDNIYNLSFSPDGTLLISLSSDMTLRFWGLAE